MITHAMLLLQASATSAGGALDVSWLDLALSAALVLVAIALSRWQRLGLEGGFFIGAVRAVVQLVAVGYVLVYLFASPRWWSVLLALAVMLVSATFTATRRRKGLPKRGDEQRRLFAIGGTSMLVSSGLTLAFVTQVVLHVRPW